MRKNQFLSITAVLMVFALAGIAGAADRDWQKGTWAKSPATGRAAPVSTHIYIIETDDFEYQAEEIVARGATPLAAPSGEPVTFAVDVNAKALYVREGDEGERSLRLMRTTRKLKTYSAAGAGHYIKAMADNGLTLTLEDGSVWDLDPARQFNTVEWQANDGISVRAYNEEEGFNYFITNTDQDLGAAARLRKAP